MSTKTSIKRIALVAAAALTLGGFTAVSSHAAGVSTTLPFYVTVADSGVQASSAADTTQSAGAVAGTYNYVALTAGSNLASTDVLGVSVTGVAGAVSIATQPTTSGQVDTLTVTGSTVASNNYRITGSVIKILTPTVGNFTVTVSKNVTNSSTGAVTTTTLQTFTFTVTAASSVGTYSAGASFSKFIETSTSALFANNAGYMALAEYETSTAALTAASTDATAPVSKGTVGSPAGIGAVFVRLQDTQASAAALAGKTLTATISGAGLIAGGGSVLADTSTAVTWQSPSIVATARTNSAGWAQFAVYNSGAAGVGTITVSYTDALGVTSVVGTKTVTFYGDIASLSATQGRYILNASGATGGTGDTTYAVQLVGKDSSGNEVDISGLTIVGTSSATSVVASTSGNGGASSGGGTLDTLARNLPVSAASGAVSGQTASITWSFTNAAGTVISTAPIKFTVGGTSISSIAPSFDKTSYNIGDLVTMTITAKDSLGNAIADGKYSLFDTTTSTTVFSTSAQLTTAPFGSRYVDFVSGKATATFYAPYTVGDLNMKAHIWASAPTAFGVVAALADTDLAAKATIAGAVGDTSSLAYDAASAATDAANNAYEEAQNATQAASDALAAVKALAVQVKALIALVNKIKAKLKA